MNPETTSTIPLDSPQAWRHYLHEQSQRSIAAMPDWEREDNDVTLGTWQGQDPASAQDIAAAEERLGVRLPADYRDFLLASNGWDSVSIFDFYGMFPISEVVWMREHFPGFAEELADDDNELWSSAVAHGLAIGSGGNGCWWIMEFPTDGQDATTSFWAMSSGEDPERHESFTAAVRNLEE